MIFVILKFSMNDVDDQSYNHINSVEVSILFSERIFEIILCNKTIIIKPKNNNQTELIKSMIFRLL